jgi:UDP-N-acetylmuramoyl-tripeptide--D-alanyl-D-alanine ligase
LPDVAIETRVSPAHLLNFSSVEEIALAKRELIEGLRGGNSVAVLNADDPRVAAMAAVAPGRVIFYGVEKLAEYSAEEIDDRGALGSSFTLVHRGKRTRLELPLPGRHAVTNALAALAAASLWNIGAAEAEQVFRGLRTPVMRGQLIRFTIGFALINDSYNSSPAALQAMINLLAATPGYQRRILVAGEMRELGPDSAELHRQAGEHAAKTGRIDYVISVQGDAGQIVEGAVAKGLPRERTKSFATPAEAAEFLAGFVRLGDLLLVKGSRSVKMERVVEEFLGRFRPLDAPSSAGARH